MQLIAHGFVSRSLERQDKVIGQVFEQNKKKKKKIMKISILP